MLTYFVGPYGASVKGPFAEFLFYPQQFVILADPVGPAHGTRFDLAGAHAHHEMRDRRVFRLPGAVGDNSRVAGFFRHFYGFFCFREGPDLVHFYKDRIGDALFYAHFEAFGVRHE